MAKSDAPDLTKFRNLGVIAHIDAGKTTTTEHLLFYAGVKHKLGGVDTGNTETDYDPEEQERGITIYSACIPFQWRGHTVNLIDTPGHVDFTAEVERSLRVLDGAVCVFDGQKGVEAQSETVWKQANKYRVPRIVFVNKMDVVGANFAGTLKTIHDRLTPDFAADGRPVPVVIPIGAGSVKDSPKPFAGVIDLIEQKAYYFDPTDLGKTVRVEAIPAEEADTAAEYREQMFDALTQHDDKDLITSTVLDGQEPDIQKVRQLIREQTLARTIYPVLCGSGREHIGIQPLLDAVTYYLPSPLDRPPVTGTNPKHPNKEEKRKPDPKEPFCGLVFKAAWHPSGHRFFIRVYSGVLKPNYRAYNTGKDTKENIAKLFHVHADPNRGLEEVENAPAGDIVAVVGLKESVTGDTLCDTQHPILLEAISFAEAVVSQSIEPESGEISAMVGDRDENSQFDLVTQARRQPGSSFKTFALIAALEQGIDPTTEFVSGEKVYEIDHGNEEPERWEVENFDGARNGSISLEEALWLSDNSVFTDLVMNAGGQGLRNGPQAFVDVAKRLGIRADFGEQLHPSLVLGTEEVSPLDMATAYATIA
ncbi:MAG: GTP-binding protein, partial [Gemmataceae bacterium]